MYNNKKKHTMKYIQTRFIACAMLAASPLMATAQDVAADELDSLANEKDKTVQVAFRKVAQKDLLGGVSVVDVEELTKKNYNTYSLDNMQGYVGGWNGNSLWAQDGDNAGYLVLVDGVPRDANNVNPTEISQITFLKGAQAVVLYGSRAAKGAIVITTKRGNVQGLEVSVRANTGFHVAKAYPEYLSSAEYMTLYNRNYLMDGNTTPKYSELDIYNHGSGINPYRYTNINYYSSDYIKKAYNRTDVTAEISGGNERAQFYSNVSYYRNGDFLNFGEAKDNYTDRFNVRGNVDVKISSFIKAYINANATFYNSKSAKGNFWNAAATMRPNFPEGAAPLIPLSMIDPNAAGAWELLSTTNNIIDGQYFLGGTQATPTNDIAAGYAGGSSKWTSRQFQFDAGVDIDLNKVLKGLSFSTKFAVDYATSYSTSFDNEYAVFIPTWSHQDGKDVIVALTKEGVDKRPGTQNVGGSSDKQTIAFSGQFNYQRTFNDDHNVSAMLIANGWQQTTSGQYHRVSNANLALQADYNYRQRYYASFGGAMIHSARLAEGHRQAFSPSVTLGWRLSEESFLKDSPVVDDLTLSVSGSILNQDIDLVVGNRSYYLYEGVWTQADGYGWYDGSAGKYTFSTRGQNNDLDFVKRKEFSVSLKASLWDKLITADASFFISKTDGLLISNPTFYPSHLNTYYPAASFMPVMNFNANQRTGFDFSINANKRFGEVDLSLGLNATYYDTKITKRDELNDYAYQNREGRPMDGIWGYQSLGIFQSEEEIAAAPAQKLGGTVKPGDLRYVDQNGDNVIDDKDQVYLGKGGWYGAPLTLGLNFTAKWRNFTFFMLATGGFGSKGMKNSSYYQMDADDKYSAIARECWTPETAATAKYPRITTLSGANNFASSDFWMYNADRIDLAKVQITYDMPRQWLAKTFLKEVSAYVSGSNLLTISGEREHLEMNIGSTPQTRFYNIGVKATF